MTNSPYVKIIITTIDSSHLFKHTKTHENKQDIMKKQTHKLEIQ